MKHRAIITLLAALLCLSLLLGCAAAPAPTEPPETEPPTEDSTTEAPTEPPTEAPTTEEPTTEAPTEPTQSPEELEREWFYHTFWELDPETTDAWLKDHPELMENGYDGISVNEAWLSDSGLDLETTLGHQVLAIDAENKILIIRAYLNGSRAVMAIAKDPSRLHLYPSASLGSVGQTVGTIAQAHDGLLAMTGSGFLDPNGAGNGGQIAGWCMCGGTTYGAHYGSSYQRIELHENNWMYVSDADEWPSEDTTDAMEFTPILLKDGEIGDPGIWTSENPRACIGQTDRGEILMLGVEGRFDDSPGCSVVRCAELMQSYHGITAMNVDGGTTAILWYRGEPIMRCSNRGTPQGRYLPNAWVYVKE